MNWGVTVNPILGNCLIRPVPCFILSERNKDGVTVVPETKSDSKQVQQLANTKAKTARCSLQLNTPSVRISTKATQYCLTGLQGKLTQ